MKLLQTQDIDIQISSYLELHEEYVFPEKICQYLYSSFEFTHHFGLLKPPLAGFFFAEPFASSACKYMF